jgi:hypothetical protein
VSKNPPKKKGDAATVVKEKPPESPTNALATKKSKVKGHSQKKATQAHCQKIPQKKVNPLRSENTQMVIAPKPPRTS